jgi:transcriptional regulator with XRE-family HTH domain
MISKDKLLKHPNYLLTKYQGEIYRQLTAYMEEHGVSQKEVAEKLGVSTSYVNQILKGNFNYTLKKLVEISLLMGKVPFIQFVSFDDYWALERKADGTKTSGAARTNKMSKASKPAGPRPRA